MGDLARKRYQLPVDRPAITFDKYREWYAANVSVHKRNTDRERSMLRQVGRYFDRWRIDQITKELALEWRTARSTEVSASTVNREFALLRHVMSSAVPKYLDRNPLTGISELRQQELDIRLVTPAEEQRLLKVANREEYALIVCALDTLQRLSTVANLRREQDKRTHLVFLNTKAAPRVKVPVSRRLRRALDRLPKNGPFYFSSFQAPTNQGLRNNVVRTFTRLCEQVRIPLGRKEGGISFHCLRHTGASRMLARGVDVKTVMELGGWQNLAVLEKYLHPTDDQRRAAVESVGLHRRALTASKRRRAG
jgi:integrase